MELRLQLLSMLVSVGLFALIFELVRRKRLLERYALLWLFSAATLLGLSAWRDLLDEISNAVGVRYGPSALFAVALGFVVILLLHFSLAISRLSDQNKVLAQRVALLEERLLRVGEPDAEDAEALSDARGAAVRR